MPIDFGEANVVMGSTQSELDIEHEASATIFSYVESEVATLAKLWVVLSERVEKLTSIMGALSRHHTALHQAGYVNPQEAAERARLDSISSAAADLKRAMSEGSPSTEVQAILDRVLGT